MSKFLMLRVSSLSVLLITFLSMWSFNVFASRQDEITHLLDYVSNTDCKYERNGTLHTGSDAVEHINKKYDYFKGDIKSTEDFIKYSATKSKMSGKFYKIHCANAKPVNSNEWLMRELERYRAPS